VGTPHQITVLLEQWGQGDQHALEELTPLVYSELHRLASRYLRRERPDHTLQSTALVNEAYLKLVGQHSMRWQNRAHFFGIAAQLIRRILVDHARTRFAEKRGSNMPRLSIEEISESAAARDLDLIALDDALEDLAKIDARQSRVVELRFFAGLSVEETAEVLQMSPATVKREWTSAKAWLFRQLRRQAADVP
jgi:RNA polymerase sigma factor (TIGR02999 family)